LVRDAEFGTSTTICGTVGRWLWSYRRIGRRDERTHRFDGGLGCIADDFEAPLPADMLREFISMG
jgi:hypothetical protein